MPYSPTYRDGKTIFSMEVPHTETATSGPIRRYPGLDGPQLSYNGCFTAYEVFRYTVSMNPDMPFLGHRPIDFEGNAGPYVFQSYGEVAHRVDNFGSGLLHEELIPPNPDGLRLLGIYIRNCPEWIIADQAAYIGHGATVPLYDTLGPESVAYVINQTELATVVCGPKELENLVAAAVSCPSLKAAIVVAPILNDHYKHLARKGGLKLYCFGDLEKLGFRYPQPHHPPEPDDVATFSYTSGTTGGPKGALITHRNLMCVYASTKALQVLQFDKDIHFSYLPLPHIYERCVQLGSIGIGAAIGFWQGTPDKLLSDMQALEPTSMPAVPRVLNRIYDKVMQGVRAVPKHRRAIFHKAYRAKLAALRRGELSRGFWDKLVFLKIRKAIGWGKLRIMVTGSAPLAPHVLDFMRVLCACSIYEGYGQTETTAMTTISFPRDYTTGHVGGVTPVGEVKLVDVPEMGYLHTDRQHGARTVAGQTAVPCVGRGEICVRGPHVFKGYYRMPEKTAEAIDEEGWLHSGDIGMWDPDGRLIIIDRKKNIFKLAQGEYVAAEKIENILQESGLIMQSFVYGDSLKSDLMAIIVPDPEALREWAEENGLHTLTHQDLCRHELLRDTITSEIDVCCKRAGLHGFEIPKATYIESEPFSPENGLLTPTQKLKRVDARERYQAVLDEMYGKLAEEARNKRRNRSKL